MNRNHRNRRQVCKKTKPRLTTPETSRLFYNLSMTSSMEVSQTKANQYEKAHLCTTSLAPVTAPPFLASPCLTNQLGTKESVTNVVASTICFPHVINMVLM